MDKEQQSEFVALRRQAHESLRSRASLDGGLVVPLCQYLVLPSFQNAICWDAVDVGTRRRAEGRLYRCCCRMDVDLQAMRSPLERLSHPKAYLPTVEVGWAPLDLARFNALLAKFRECPVALALDAPGVGLDRVGYELSIERPFFQARLCWWCELPREWTSLRPQIAELKRFFVETWAAADAGTPRADL